ncbi:MAG: MBL fold metallo-hydrolase [Deltaproteobacteria bacterium]|nr:MBL fold metallo-hydrolase [Deltaproteobacteria bacterium]
MRITFWGTRGSLVCPGPDTVRYGGNTVCVHVSEGDSSLILDAGIGIVQFGEKIMAMPKDQRPREFNVLFSHFHWDHVLGFPFFSPIYMPGNVVNLYGPNRDALEETIHRLFHSAYSPIKGAHNLAAELRYFEVPPEGCEIGGTSVRTTMLCHPEAGPNAATVAYRVQKNGKAVVYATDHEAGADPQRDQGLIALGKDAHVLIHDAYFTPEEYSARRGWGHSSFEQAVAIAEKAGVKVLVLFHYEPDHDDEQMDRILERARQAASEDLTIIAALDRGELQL